MWLEAVRVRSGGETVGVRSEVAPGWGHYKEYMKQGATKSFEWKTGLLGLRFLRDHDASVLREGKVVRVMEVDQLRGSAAVKRSSDGASAMPVAVAEDRTSRFWVS